MNELEKAKQLLKNGNFTCVTIKNGQVFTDTQNGIKPAIEHLRQDKDFFLGAVVADKVVGKAAAMLFTYGGISQLYTDVISLHALKWLKKCNVKPEYKTVAENIKNRTGTGICPMEQRVLDVDDHNTAYEIFNNIVK